MIGRPPINRKMQEHGNKETFNEYGNNNNENEENSRNDQNSENKNRYYSPSDMRLRMINELQKQEEVFACVLELSQIEQSQAIQSASQVVQQYIMQSEVRTYVRLCMRICLYMCVHTYMHICICKYI